ncbi:MAG: flagellar basal body P-ring formation chaperone FlgA [Variibacter sp.]
MSRKLILIAALLFPSAAAAQITTIAQTPLPALKAEATVTSDVVRIRDLVENPGVVADVAIFRSPDLGHTGTVETARIIDAIRPYKLVGIDTRGLTEVVVTRTSRTITTKQLEERIAAALAKRPGLGDAKDIAVTFDRDIRALEIDPAAIGTLHVARLYYDPSNGRFDITFELPGQTARRSLLRYTGIATETVPAVIPLRALGRGETIRESDVVLERRPKAEAGDGIVGRMDAAVGMAVKRALRVGQALRTADLMKPEVVKQNETVTITYQRPGIVLSIRGKALESGAEGDVVNVLNVQSKRTIQTTVAGPGRVIAAPEAPAALSVSARETAITVADSTGSHQAE